MNIFAALLIQVLWFSYDRLPVIFYLVSLLAVRASSML